MKKKKMRSLILIVCWSLILLPRTSQAMGIEGAIGIWNQNPQGGIGYKGDSLDLDNDLKYTQTTRFFGRAKIETPLIFPNIYLQVTPLRFDGTGTKNVAFRFGDQNFTANQSFSSNIKLDHYDVALYYGVPFLKLATLGMLNVDVGLNLRFIDFKAEVSQGTIGDSKSFILPVPMLYLGAQGKILDSLSLEGELRAMAYNANHYYDLVGRVKYKVFGPAFVSVGYRHEEISIDAYDIKANIRFSGPLLEAGLIF